ncbi:MAG: FCD domain-containing protein [Propionibacteriaceae bacterium]|jgi:DNA-binding FadR family transcriptional regulator|nr:FCD domain-containing protein [Propionibacteriaceae bacterium]
MKRNSLVEELTGSLLDNIVDGEYSVSDTLPPEARLADAAGVSRLTVREAVGNLRARNIVSVRRGLGTFVNPVEDWSDLDAVVYAAIRRGDETVAKQLLEVRRIVEVGGAELAAQNRDGDLVAALDQAMRDLEAADSADDVPAAAAADLAFHDAVLRATKNPFVPVLYAQMRQILEATRQQTSSVPQVRSRAITHHRAIRDAIAAGLGAAAREAMDAHMDQTWDDYRRIIGTDEGDYRG